MLDFLKLQFDSIPDGFLVLIVIALVVSSIGFYRTTYFISIGYAFSITVMVAAVLIIGSPYLNWVSILQNLGLLIWSVRLGIYLWQRERKTIYREAAERAYQSTAKVTLPIKAAIWISVSLLYAAMFSPSLFRLVNLTSPTSAAVIVEVIGLIVLFGGVIIEGVADQQKNDFKAKYPKQFCNVGLYRWVRCPNYLGEILVWVGSWIIALMFFNSALEALISTVGLLCIILIMMGSTKRLERTQLERYGSDQAYQRYISSVPVLFPYLPLYTLKNVRVYLE